MDSIFGISMNLILVVTLAIMGVCLLTVGIIAWRNLVIFKMAVRNIPRRKAQTVLIMIGLMLSTLIIAASLTTGDTLDYSITSSTYDGLGQVDETIAFVGEAGGEGTVSTNNVPIPATIADDLERRFADDPDIDAIMPVLTIGVPVINTTSQLSEPQTVMTGLDAEHLSGFGGLQTADGSEIDFASLPANSGVLSEDLAEHLDAEIGDTLTFFYSNQPYALTVGAIVSGSLLTGYEASAGQAGPAQTTATDLLGVAVPLGWLQELTGLDGQARFIAVSNTGGVEDSLQYSDTAIEKLQVALSEIDGGSQLGVNPLKQDAIDGAESFGNIFSTLFLLFGMFSIAAGVLLIFLIFMMLAAERRSEMGMARAVGMKRSHLVQGFIAEGAAYDLGAALVGATIGVGVAFGIVLGLGSLLGDAFVSITPHATWRSLAIAYSLGVSVTFLTIVFASVRSSRLNIVAAIRDLPEEKHPDRGSRPRWIWWSHLPHAGGVAGAIVSFPLELIWNVVLAPLKLVVWSIRMLGHAVGWGPVVAAVGAAFMGLGIVLQGYFAFALGLSLFVLGLSLFLRRLLASRLVFTIASAFMLLFWLLPEGVTGRVLPELGDGGPEMFFLSGIFMVTYTTLILMWNAEIIVKLVALLGHGFSRWLPAVKTAVAYPLASKGRTGLTIAMFAMVIFSIVTVRTINANFISLLLTDEADAGWDVAVVTSPINPIDDLASTLAGSDVNLDDIDATGSIATIAGSNGQVRNPDDPTWSRLTINGMDDQFINDAVIPLGARASDYDSDEAVWNAIRSGDRVAIVDSSVLERDGFDSGDSARYLAPDGVVADNEILSAFDIELQNARSGDLETVTVIGVIDTKVSTLSGLYLSRAVVNKLSGEPDYTVAYVRLSDESSSNARELAKQIEAALQSSGAQAVSIEEQIEEQQEFSNGFFILLQGFMGLGLFVGIAALGVISFRSVVERRQQIGMLRAIGYQRGMVAASFLIESLVIATLGVISGATLAIILSYNLIMGGGIDENVEFTSFVIPWGTIIFFITASLVAAAVMTWIPARQASSVPIAEALRYE